MAHEKFEQNEDSPIGSPSFEAIAKELGVEPVVFMNEARNNLEKTENADLYILDSLDKYAYEGFKEVKNYIYGEMLRFRNKKDLQGDPKVLEEANKFLKTIFENLPNEKEKIKPPVYDPEKISPNRLPEKNKDIIDKTIIDFAMSRFEHFYKTLDRRIEDAATHEAKYRDILIEEARKDLMSKVSRKGIDQIYDGLHSFLETGEWNTRYGRGRRVMVENLKSKSDFVLERLTDGLEKGSGTKHLGSPGKIFAPDKYKE